VLSVANKVKSFLNLIVHIFLQIMSHHQLRL